MYSHQTGVGPQGFSEIPTPSGGYSTNEWWIFKQISEEAVRLEAEGSSVADDQVVQEADADGRCG